MPIEGTRTRSGLCLQFFGHVRRDLYRHVDGSWRGIICRHKGLFLFPDALDDSAAPTAVFTLWKRDEDIRIVDESIKQNNNGHNYRRSEEVDEQRPVDKLALYTETYHPTS